MDFRENPNTVFGTECCALCYCWVTRNAALHPCPPYPPHEVKVLPFVFKVWVHLGALDMWEWSRWTLHMGEFSLIWFSNHKQCLLYCCWNKAMGSIPRCQDTQHTQFPHLLDTHLNHIVSFHLKEESQALLPTCFPSSVDFCSVKIVVQHISSCFILRSIFNI